jgi:hypothetical protein
MQSDDRMRAGTVAFLSAERQVADMMSSASARFVEREFDPGLPQGVLWSNFRRLGFCHSSVFSSLRVGVEDFSDYFANVPVQIPTASEHLGGFPFRHIDLVECFSAFKIITSNAVGVDCISVEFFKPLLLLICCHVLHVFNHAITSSIFPSLWKVAIIRPVA